MDKNQLTRTLAVQQTSAPVEAGDVASTIGATLHRAKQFTTSPVEMGAVGSPEFCRPADSRHLFGIGRSYIYELISEGVIKSVSLRRRGAKTGIRLIDVASVREYLRGQFNQPTNG